MVVFLVLLIWYIDPFTLQVALEAIGVFGALVFGVRRVVH